MYTAGEYTGKSITSLAQSQGFPHSISEHFRIFFSSDSTGKLFFHVLIYLFDFFYAVHHLCNGASIIVAGNL